MSVEPKSFAARCAEFFGRKPNQSISEFAAELKQLTDDDKRWFIEQFNKLGLLIKE